MARKPTVNTEALAALGVDRLAALVMEGTERDAAFKKIVAAALAGAKGPEAVAALIDRRLAALEKARSFIDWNKARAFTADLASLVSAIVTELGPTAPRAAFDRLVRFIRTHPSVFGRVDDSAGRVQDVYEGAVEEAAILFDRIAPTERVELLPTVEHAMTEASHGYFKWLACLMAPRLGPDVLKAWDGRLAKMAAGLPKDEDRDGVTPGQLVEVRQSIADALGDLDGWIALEGAKPDFLRDTKQMALRLTEAGRHAEALQWVRRGRHGDLDDMTAADVADDPALTVTNWTDTGRVLLEARILDDLGRKAEAQTARWGCFETTLRADVLKVYIAGLGDFEEFDAVDKALAVALAHPNRHRALTFLVTWKRLDLAAKLVVDRASEWSGAAYDVLGPMATELAEAQPLAATILYRALLDDILDRGKSQAYGHGARYLAALDRLAPHIGDGWGEIEPHDVWREALRRRHGRKYSFWAACGDGA